MRKVSHRERIDSLISQFWKDGYLTISRRHGHYLPAPRNVGNYEIDALGKYKKNYVIGISLTEEDFNNSRILAKIKYLSSRNTIYSLKSVRLFIGVPSKLLTRAHNLISDLPSENKESIKLVPVSSSPAY